MDRFEQELRELLLNPKAFDARVTKGASENGRATLRDDLGRTIRADVINGDLQSGVAPVFETDGGRYVALGQPRTVIGVRRDQGYRSVEEPAILGSPTPAAADVGILFRKRNGPNWEFFVGGAFENPVLVYTMPIGGALQEDYFSESLLTNRTSVLNCTNNGVSGTGTNPADRNILSGVDFGILYSEFSFFAEFTDSYRDPFHSLTDAVASVSIREVDTGFVGNTLSVTLRPSPLPSGGNPWSPTDIVVTSEGDMTITSLSQVVNNSGAASIHRTDLVANGSVLRVAYPVDKSAATQGSLLSASSDAIPVWQSTSPALVCGDDSTGGLSAAVALIGSTSGDYQPLNPNDGWISPNPDGGYYVGIRHSWNGSEWQVERFTVSADGNVSAGVTGTDYQDFKASPTWLDEDDGLPLPTAALTTDREFWIRFPNIENNENGFAGFTQSGSIFSNPGLSAPVDPDAATELLEEGEEIKPYSSLIDSDNGIYATLNPTPLISGLSGVQTVTAYTYTFVGDQPTFVGAIERQAFPLPSLDPGSYFSNVVGQESVGDLVFGVAINAAQS